MPWRSVTFPDSTGADFDETAYFNGKLYGVGQVGRGGNYKIHELDLATGATKTMDSGIPIPSTDPHYSIRFILPTSDGTKLIGCWARWTGLNCYEFDIATGAGSRLGELGLGEGLNYPHLVKIKEDAYYMIARGGTGNNGALFRFKGAPEQIMDRSLWEKLGDVVDDSDVTPSTCADGSINFTYSRMFADMRGYIVIAVTTRCPSAGIGKFALAFFDVLREKLYNTKFEEVPFGQTSYNSPLTITPSGFPWALYLQHIVLALHAIDFTNKKAYLMGLAKDTTGAEHEYIHAVDMEARTSTVIQCPGDRCAPILPLSDGKIILLYKDPADGKFKVGRFNPSTKTVEEVYHTLTTTDQYGYRPMFLATEDVYTPIPGMAAISREVVIPDPLDKALAIPNRITVSSPAANQLRVQAEFERAPSSIRVKLYNTATGTLTDLDTLTGSTSIDKTYSGIPAGRYRVRVEAVP